MEIPYQLRLTYDFPVLSSSASELLLLRSTFSLSISSNVRHFPVKASIFFLKWRKKDNLRVNPEYLPSQARHFGRFAKLEHIVHVMLDSTVKTFVPQWKRQKVGLLLRTALRTLFMRARSTVKIQCYEVRRGWENVHLACLGSQAQRMVWPHFARSRGQP